MANQNNPRISPKNVSIGVAIAGTLVIGAASFDRALDRDEGNKTIPYKDIVGIVTVCRGYTGPEPIIWGKVYTLVECQALNRKAADEHQLAALKYIKVPIAQTELEAYGNFTYWQGEGKWRSSTSLKRLNEGDYEGACKGILLYNGVNQVNKKTGKKEHIVVPALANRAKRLYDLCMSPVTLPEDVVFIDKPIQVEKQGEKNVQVVAPAQPVQDLPPAPRSGWDRIRCLFLRCEAGREKVVIEGQPAS